MMRKSLSKCFTGKSAKAKNDINGSNFKFDEKIIIEVFYSVNQQKRRRI
jgi:hypothetical protein